MLSVSSPKTARELLDKYALAPLKKFGQNFLIDDNILRRIAEAVPAGGCALEIGAGLGALTQKLAARAKSVLVYEIDKGLCGVLTETLADFDNVTVKNEDVLKASIESDVAEAFGDAEFFAAANLPYYITSACIMRLLESDLPLTGMVLMMQKEVAQRLCAPPGNADYGAITAAVSFFSEPRVLFTVSRNCFYPRPDVDSAVVLLPVARQDKALKDAYLRFVKGLFAMRRKTVLNNLLQMGYTREAAEDLLSRALIEPQRRAETLSREDFLSLCRAEGLKACKT